MRLIKTLSFLLWMAALVRGQETEVIKKTPIFPNPKADRKSASGQLYPGAKVVKLKKDETGKFVKATIEFYIPIESLEEGRVALTVGETQTADNAKYKLLGAVRDGKRVHLTLKVTNIHSSKDLDFSAMALIKIVRAGGKKGELNPFEGKHQGLAFIAPGKSVNAELVYDFKSKPNGIELICTGKLGGDRVYYSLGF